MSKAATARTQKGQRPGVQRDGIDDPQRGTPTPTGPPTPLQLASEKLTLMVDKVIDRLRKSRVEVAIKMVLAEVGLPLWSTWPRQLQEAMSVGINARVTDRQFVEAVVVFAALSKSVSAPTRLANLVAVTAGFHALQEMASGTAKVLWAERYGAKM